MHVFSSKVNENRKLVLLIDKKLNNLFGCIENFSKFAAQ